MRDDERLVRVTELHCAVGQVRLIISDGAEITSVHVNLNDFRMFVCSHKIPLSSDFRVALERLRDMNFNFYANE